MKKLNVKLIEKNTELLGKLLRTKPPAVERLETILQIFENLEILETNMQSKDFKAKFGELQVMVQSYINKITDQKFVKELMEKINALLQKNKINK